MASSILTSIVKFAASAAWDQIKSHLFKPDTSVIDAILGGFDKLEHLIKELDYEDKLWEPMTKIYYWVDRTKTVVDDLNSEDNEAHREAYDNVISALKSESDGIRFQTYSIYSLLMKDETPMSPEGLLKYWADEAYKKLAKEDDMNYHTSDYIQELDLNIAAVAALLHHALMLSMFISATENDAEAFRTEAETRVRSFCDALYEKLYPPVLRQIKSSYDDAGTFLTDGRWFNIYSDIFDECFLSIHNYWIREIGLHTPEGDNSAKLRAFRFVASDSKQPLGPLQMHAYWDDRKKTRVLYYHGYGDGLHKEYAYTNSESSDTDKALFKLIPLALGFWLSKPPLKLIPYREDTGEKTKPDQVNTWATVWRLVVTSSPQ